jgi:peptidyl-prolyl cis-trans isomerase D
LLDSFRRGQRWLSLIFVSVIGLVFVFFLGAGGGGGPTTPTGSAIIQLDDVRLTSRDFAREKYNTEARLREQLGDSFDQLGAERYVDSQALGAMVNSVILSSAAKELGLHVTQDELRRIVQTNPNFLDEEGRFSTANFDRFAAYEYGSQRAFIKTFTRSLLGQKLIWLLVGQTTLSDAEIDLRTRYDLEEVRIAFIAFDSGVLGEGEVVDEDVVEAYAAENEAELKALFESRAAEFSEPERVRARHILKLVGAEASAEEQNTAKAAVQAARDRVAAGEDFAAVAAEVSEDVGTAPNGGDMGLFARGDNDSSIDEAAFALETGGLSEVIQSAYGFHVIQVDEKVAPVTGVFETQRLALAREQATRARAFDRANEKSQALAAAIESGASLEDAARAEGLDVERPASLKRRSDGFIPGLGAAEELLAASFTLEAGQSSPEIFELPGRRVLVQVLERTSPDATILEAERDTRRERATVEKQNRVLQAWINDYRSQLETSGRLLVNSELALGS